MKPRPVVLLMGDSTTVQTVDRMVVALGDDVELVASPNVSTSGNFLEHLDEWTEGVTPDLVYFNTGLHDLGRDKQTHEFRHHGTSDLSEVLDTYRSNLRAIIGRLRELVGEGRLVWGTSTPVIFERHLGTKDFDRDERDVVAFNEAALEVVEEPGVTVHDRHRVIVESGVEECLRPDGVHMLEYGLDTLANAVAAFIREQLVDMLA